MKNVGLMRNEECDYERRSNRTLSTTLFEKSHMESWGLSRTRQGVLNGEEMWLRIKKTRRNIVETAIGLNSLE